MKNALVLAVVLAATPVVMAQPVTRPDTCGVTIAYAPDDARAIVDNWVRQEAHCDKTLEVRIVPTDGGLYLFARDERGFVRERIVPDAQSAAVLVTSWLVDDSRPPPPPPLPWPPRVPPPDYTLDPFDAGPAVTKKTTPSYASKWVALGPLMIVQGRGLRTEVDFYAWQRWKLGAAGSLSSTETFALTVQGPQYPYQHHPMKIFDARAVVYLTRQLTAGKWYARPAIAAGFTYTNAEIEVDVTTDPWSPDYMTLRGHGVVPTAEVSFLIGRTLGENWALDAGPIWSMLGDGPSNEYMHISRQGERSFFASLRHRL